MSFGQLLPASISLHAQRQREIGSGDAQHRGDMLG